MEHLVGASPGYRDPQANVPTEDTPQSYVEQLTMEVDAQRGAIIELRKLADGITNALLGELPQSENPEVSVEKIGSGRLSCLLNSMRENRLLLRYCAETLNRLEREA